jgi:hypothetical protein
MTMKTADGDTTCGFELEVRLMREYEKTYVTKKISRRNEQKGLSFVQQGVVLNSVIA